MLTAKQTCLIHSLFVSFKCQLTNQGQNCVYVETLLIMCIYQKIYSNTHTLFCFLEFAFYIHIDQLSDTYLNSFVVHQQLKTQLISL